jgi:PilZ domain-containing protein
MEPRRREFLAEYEYPRLSSRHPFVADVQVTDVQSEMQITGRAKDLSLFGCSVNTSKPFPKGTSIRIKLSHGGSDVAALARVVYARPDLGMGVAFTSIEPKDERILQAWIAELTSEPIANA